MFLHLCILLCHHHNVLLHLHFNPFNFHFHHVQFQCFACSLVCFDIVLTNMCSLLCLLAVSTSLPCDLCLFHCYIFTKCLVCMFYTITIIVYMFLSFQFSACFFQFHHGGFIAYVEHAYVLYLKMWLWREPKTCVLVAPRMQTLSALNFEYSWCTYVPFL